MFLVLIVTNLLFLCPFILKNRKGNQQVKKYSYVCKKL